MTTTIPPPGAATSGEDPIEDPVEETSPRPASPAPGRSAAEITSDGVPLVTSPTSATASATPVTGKATTASTTPPGGVVPRVIYPEGHVLDRYRLDAVVGHGAWSTVYRATDMALSLPVVVKVLSPEASADAVERFRNEILFSRRVHHPGFCRIYELHEDETFDGPLRYLTMELVQGRTLGDLMNEGPMDVRRALSIARSLCDVAAAAHSQGVIHGDLKPGNVMVRAVGERRFSERRAERRQEPRDELVVLDFGAAFAKDVGGSAVRVGSVRYMAPELFEQEPPSPQSDVWAIGVILYGCLTGGYPFDGAREQDVAEATRRPPPPPSQARGTLPPDVDGVVLRALERQRSERFADCRAFASALDDVLEQLRPRGSLLRRLWTALRQR
jgi:serine/threonine-protein kinase